MIDRLASVEVADALTDTPVVLIHGPRQCGKSTVAREFESSERRYITFDNLLMLERATANPLKFLKDFDGPLILDEVQRVPKLFLPLKMLVDEDRTPGRFLLTGSANVMTLPKVADSLAGRMAIVDLLPFSQSELEGSPANFVSNLFAGDLSFKSPEADDEDLVRRMTVGGFPESVARKSSASRDRWFEDYLRALIERDVRDLANIEALSQIPRLLRLLAARSGSTLNVSGLARDTGIPNTSLHRYIELLEAIFLIQTIPTWSNNRGARITKTPKSYLVDTGLLCHLENLSTANLSASSERLESTLKSFVALELKKLARFAPQRPILHHLRTVTQLEVDFVLEAKGGTIVGIETSLGRSVGREDIRGLEYLSELAGDDFKLGVVLYRGKAVEQITGKIWAIPVSALWN